MRTHSVTGSSIVFDYMYASALTAARKRGEIARVERAWWYTGEGLVFGIEEGEAEAFLEARGYTQFVIGTAWSLAFYRVLSAQGETLEAVGRLIYEMDWAYLQAYPRFLRRLSGCTTFSRRHVRRLRKGAALLQERRYPGNYVFTFVEGDGETFDYGVDPSPERVYVLVRRRLSSGPGQEHSPWTRRRMCVAWWFTCRRTVFLALNGLSMACFLLKTRRGVLAGKRKRWPATQASALAVGRQLLKTVFRTRAWKWRWFRGTGRTPGDTHFFDVNNEISNDVASRIDLAELHDRVPAVSGP